jgi:hypothetical protein
MKITPLLLLLIASTAAAQAQAGAQRSPEPSVRPQPASTKKVWTNDDVGSLRTPADIYLEEKKLQAEKAEKEAKAKAVTVQEDPSAVKPDPTAHPPRLSNPKTPEAADEMIAWEQRDIDAQGEYVDRLRKQLDESPAAEKAHIQELIEERTRIIAETKAEQLGLKQQKKQLEKKRDAAQPEQPPQ